MQKDEFDKIFQIFFSDFFCCCSLNGYNHCNQFKLTAPSKISLTNITHNITHTSATHTKKNINSKKEPLKTAEPK